MTRKVAGTLQQRAFHLRKRLMIHGIVRGVMMTARKLTPGVLARQVGIRNFLGANLISLWGTRNLLGTTQGSVTMTMRIIEVDLDVEIEAEGEEGILGMVVGHHGMEAIETMNQVAEGLESHGTEGTLMVAEEEAEVVLGEVTVTRATTSGQEMVAAGALAGEMVAAVVTGTGTITMSDPSVKVVAGPSPSLPIGMPTKEMAKEIKLSRKASPAGKHKTPLVEMVRQERVMQTTPGVRTDHLHLSCVSQAVMLTSLALGALPVEELAAEVLGERATRMAGTQREDQPKRSLHGVVGQKRLPRKRTKVVRGTGAKEEVVSVPGIKGQMMHGTATRVVILGVVDGKISAKII
jgi:hypothetical protein